MPTLPAPLRGIIPPMVTPLLTPDRLDPDGTARLVEHILAGGVHGLFILGTTGEGPGISHAMQRELVTAVCRQVTGRVPVLVGITDCAFGESVMLAEHACAEGAAGLVVAPPHYFSTTQDELLGYFARLAAAVPLPVLLYNMPTHTKVFIEARTVAAAADIPNIAGLKDSSGNMVYFHTVRSLLTNRPDFSLLVGPEELLAESVLLGGHGGVNGGANLFPRLYVSLYEAARTGDLPTVRRLHDTVMKISREVYTVGGRGSSMLGGLKTALHLKNLCGSAMAEPFSAFGETERSLIAERLERIIVPQ